MKGEKIRWPICFRLGDGEFDMREEGVEKGIRRWQISQVRVYKEEAIGHSEKR